MDEAVVVAEEEDVEEEKEVEEDAGFVLSITVLLSSP